MHIGINVAPLQTGHNHRGTGSYIRLLLQAFKTYANDHSYYEFTSLVDVPDSVRCVHYPFFDPFFLTLPEFTSKPIIVTVHDLIPIVYKKHFPVGIRGNIKWEIQKRRLQRATKIITDSVSSKNDIVSILKIDESRVIVIPLAAPPEYRKVIDKDRIEQIKKKYGLPNDFLLYVGDVNWNKNIPTLLRAMKYIDRPLVLVGKAFLNGVIPEVKEINNIIAKENIHDKIVLPGFIDSEDLPVVYSVARLTLCVSYAEGFGFPVLESMSCGTPCVVSNRSSLVEIAGPSTLVDPWDVQNIVTGVGKALTVEKGHAYQGLQDWVKQYSWKKVVHETLAVYESI